MFDIFMQKGLKTGLDKYLTTLVSSFKGLQHWDTVTDLSRLPGVVVLRRQVRNSQVWSDLDSAVSLRGTSFME